jgi:hypothetical protein
VAHIAAWRPGSTAPATQENAQVWLSALKWDETGLPLPVGFASNPSANRVQTLTFCGN